MNYVQYFPFIAIVLLVGADLRGSSTETQQSREESSRGVKEIEV